MSPTPVLAALLVAALTVHSCSGLMSLHDIREMSVGRSGDLLLALTLKNEVHQFIGNSGWRKLNFTDVRAIATGYDHSIWLVTGKNELLRARIVQGQYADAVQFSPVNTPRKHEVSFVELTAKNYDEVYGLAANRSLYQLRDGAWRRLADAGYVKKASLCVYETLYVVNMKNQLHQFKGGRLESSKRDAATVDCNSNLVITSPNNHEVFSWRGDWRNEWHNCPRAGFVGSQIYCLRTDRRIGIIGL